MLKRDDPAFRLVSERVAATVQNFCRRMAAKKLLREEDITSRFLEKLEDHLIVESPQYSIKATTITIDRYLEERPLGADAIILLSYVSSEVTLSKGVLVQAKMVDPGVQMKPSEVNRLKSQCEVMLEASPESYVWTYSSNGFFSYRSCVVRALTTRRPDDLCGLDIPEFVSRFLRCQIGDPQLSLQGFDRLRDIIAGQRVHKVLVVTMNSFKDGPTGTREGQPTGTPPSTDQLAKKLRAEFSASESGHLTEEEVEATLRALQNPADLGFS